VQHVIESAHGSGVGHFLCIYSRRLWATAEKMVNVMTLSSQRA
jgi:hypothetical protein